MKKLIDRFDRIHNSIRISLSEDESLYCVYCDPSISSKKAPEKKETLSFDNILRLINIFVSELGITDIKFTGSEPLARENIFDFFKKVSDYHNENNLKLGLTTSGLFLYDKLELLQGYGINRININLNTLNKNKFKRISPEIELNEIIKSIDKAEKIGMNPIKINCTVIKGFNDDELSDFIEFGKNRNINIRFIEFLPFSDNRWGVNTYYSIEQIIKKISVEYPLEKLKTDSFDIARNYRIKNYKGILSFVSSVTNHFCTSCNRLRITSNGNLLMCLFSLKNKDVNLKELLDRGELSDKEIAEFISNLLFKKDLHHPDVEKFLLLSKSNVQTIRE